VVVRGLEESLKLVKMPSLFKPGPSTGFPPATDCCTTTASNDPDPQRDCLERIKLYVQPFPPCLLALSTFSI
jgi:hypothetical protein